MKKVYVGFAADIIHYGHINILNVARRYGYVIIGLLTDKAIESYKRKPLMSYKQRSIVIKNIIGVDKVVPQTTHDYTNNLLKLKPDYVVHGDDWKTGPQKKTREKIINVLKKWDGKLIEVPYSKGISTTEILKRIKSELNNRN